MASVWMTALRAAARSTARACPGTGLSWMKGTRSKTHGVQGVLATWLHAAGRMLAPAARTANHPPLLHVLQTPPRAPLLHAGCSSRSGCACCARASGSSSAARPSRTTCWSCMRSLTSLHLACWVSSRPAAPATLCWRAWPKQRPRCHKLHAHGLAPRQPFPPAADLLRILCLMSAPPVPAGDARAFKMAFERPITIGQDRNAVTRAQQFGAATSAELRRIISPYMLRCAGKKGVAPVGEVVCARAPLLAHTSCISVTALP